MGVLRDAPSVPVLQTSTMFRFASALMVAKLNALAMAQITGDIPQNVNFAIKVSTLVNFLEANKIAYEADSSSHELSNTQRAERAEASSSQLECWK